ncbi:CGNR zinc finger domain-containing protein [Pseudonocardia eucalypti]|uniref:CGNR zinc finger domain-containing protein n=1 Tax=Pseudonocardia eucalypti TaxID=648755 RepID=A0ABP9Q0L7_9PSEU|nr:putative RNA-binding Zn ribbon-like protein [Pseudonocardia eucalypti]
MSSYDRPLVGEPLGLDLLNTVWLGRGGARDLLADEAGLRAWLTQAGLDAPVSEPARLAAVTAREAIRAHLADPDSPATRATLNEVLAWGRHRPLLDDTGAPGAVAELVEADRRAGWLAAVDYLRLRERDADRIRRCAHPDCVLYFYDTSPKRARRWCSMAGCGNRAKAARHYARAKEG